MDSESSLGLKDHRPRLQRRMLTPFLTKNVPPIPKEEERKEFPRYNNPFRWIFFQWLWPVLHVGYKRTLDPKDLFRLNDDIRVQSLADRFEKNFLAQLAKEQDEFILNKVKGRGETLENTSISRRIELRDYKPSRNLCIYAAFQTFRTQYILSCMFLALGMASGTCNPLLSKKLIAYVEKKALGYELSNAQGVGYAIGVSLLVFVGEVLMNQGMFMSKLSGAELKALFSKLLMDKAFRLSDRSRKQFSPAKITSIMSTDVSRIDLGIGYSPFLFIFVVPMAIAIGILIHNLKATAMVGVGVMFVFLLACSGLGTVLLAYRTKAMKQTDTRVSLMKEVLNNLKMIKFYSWEIPYLNKIKSSRTKEMRYLLNMEVIRSVILSLATSLTLIASFAAFMVLYAIAPSHNRNPASIFSSLTLFNILATSFVMLPFAISGVADAYVAFQRVGELLAAEELEIDEMRQTSPEQLLDLQKRQIALEVQSGSFEWELHEVKSDEGDNNEKDESQIKERTMEMESVSLNDESGKTPIDERISFKLRNIDLSIKEGEFIVITGSIGTGKTSLLNAFNGQMKRSLGSVCSNGKIIMCGAPWIQNATVKENVTFNSPLDENKYLKVIHACNLDIDLAVLPAGDKTEIGERGITLSGGQKARLSLARAVYTDADIILLDDVLSAVDSKVGKHIMDECLLGILLTKTRVLATHQLSLIGSADRVIYLNGDGSISVGTIENLQKTNKGFKELMKYDQQKIVPETDGSDNDEEHITTKEITRSSTKLTIEADDGKLISEEFKQVNAIGWDVYRRYIGAGAAGFKFGWIIPATLLGTILAVFLNLFTNTWLSFWVSQKFHGKGDGFYIALYTVLTFMAVVVMVIQFLTIIYVMNRSSRRLNIKATKRVLHVPMSYMDITPMGRIINRFTKDTDVLDNEMGDKIAMTLYFVTTICGIFILCIIYIPWFAIAVPIIFGLFIAFVNFYQASGREIKRVEAVQRSHVYNNFNETLTGMDTIKSYNKSSVFMNKNINLIDKMNEAYYITVANQRWLEVNLSVMATALAFLVALLCVFRAFKINAASVGLLLSYILDISGMLSNLVVIFTDVEQDMNSAERVIEYAYDVPQEAPFIISETCPPPQWPEKAAIRFDDVTLSYRLGLPPVLKNFNAYIRPHEKIGVCGRTGAGKSSIMAALYRLVELSEGKIEIDDIDIKSLGLNNLRSKLSIIPQDPILFKGTIRSNLDPFSERSDNELWDIMKRARIIESEDFESVRAQQKDEVNLHKFHLDKEVDDDGDNFSLGEKQLIAFARALVRGTRVLIMDEATSSVDYATDSKIQSAISNEFADCTILCIAHRLKTILNYDRIMVLEKGEIKEFDTPWNLFSHRAGIFRLMCDKSSILASDFKRPAFTED